MKPTNAIHYFVKPSDILSLGNGLCGIVAILLSIEHHSVLAVLCISIGGMFDFMDGKVARKYGYASEFGKQLDSLCDLISFIIAPAVFAFIFLPVTDIWQEIILIAYVAAGLLRLARFNVTGTFENGKYFEGTPVPFSIAIVLFYFILPHTAIFLFLWLLLYLIHAILMVSTLKIRKL